MFCFYVSSFPTVSARYPYRLWTYPGSLSHTDANHISIDQWHHIYYVTLVVCGYYRRRILPCGVRTKPWMYMYSGEHHHFDDNNVTNGLLTSQPLTIPQQPHHAIMTSLLRQNDVINYVKMTSFWRYNIIITSCVQWTIIISLLSVTRYVCCVGFTSRCSSNRVGMVVTVDLVPSLRQYN